MKVKLLLYLTTAPLEVFFFFSFELYDFLFTFGFNSFAMMCFMYKFVSSC